MERAPFPESIPGEQQWLRPAESQGELSTGAGIPSRTRVAHTPLWQGWQCHPEVTALAEDKVPVWSRCRRGKLLLCFACKSKPESCCSQTLAAPAG